MTTYGTFSIDSVPPPADFELAPPVLNPAHYASFNSFCTVDGITGQRENFHRWLVANQLTGLHSFDDWRCLFLMFEDERDSRDERDTLADSLSTLF